MSFDKAKDYECTIDLDGTVGTFYVVAESVADAQRKVAWMFQLCKFSIREDAQ